MAGLEGQMEFETAVKHTNAAFPKQINGRPLFDRWDECQKHIKQALALAKYFQEHNKDDPPIQTLPELGELLKNCIWYLYEFGRLDDALELLNIAYASVPDKQSALYAHLCNSAAVIYYEQNDLGPCREFNEKSLKIREAVLASDDLDLVNSYHNLGALASAQGRYDEALELYAKTEKPRMKAGEEAVISLGLTHMMVGRVYFLRKEYSAASNRYDMAEAIFKTSPGPSSQLMAHLIYAFGNLEYAQGRVETAKDLYEKGHKMSHDLGPKHLLTATFDYKLGVVQSKLEHYNKAMERLQSALAVVEGHKARGDTARILRRQAIVIRANDLSTLAQEKEADKLMAKAEAIRVELSDRGDQDLSLPADLVYDNLVCGYFR